ncbi:MAG TPA: 2-oxo-4-hydroxy-4-carboxy-5-ureidoimidazoline decarboxylase [Candidatus Limnocylindrales bacterium]|nr:2-oxo-4-hydroxy-4-carboxy-5-ureidoimidazoline decarboxylase [Candidatus Limnocylindrales bacterium]
MRPSAQALGELFENAPRFVNRLVDFAAASWDELFDEAQRLALEMPEDEQIELLDAHPRIGAAATSVSALSYAEQGYDNDVGTAELQARLDRLNEAYEDRYGFRFVVFVNGRSRAQIADVMEAILETPELSPRDSEKERGLEDVIAIASSRLPKVTNVRRVDEGRDLLRQG